MEAIDVNAKEKNITISSHINSGQFVIEVKDSGAGFDKCTGDQLFKRGFTTKTSGSGLGLNNCRSIVESHEGTIEIMSEGTGKGALVSVTLGL